MRFIPIKSDGETKRVGEQDTRRAKVEPHISPNDDGTPCMITQAGELACGSFVQDGVDIPMLRVLHGQMPVGLIYLLSIDEARMVGTELLRMVEAHEAAAAATLDELLAKREPGA